MKTKLQSLVAALKLDRIKAVLFDRSGAMLWVSPLWEHTDNTAPHPESHVLGRRYREFISDANLTKFDELFHAQDRAVVRMLRPGAGTFETILFRRTEIGPYLLIVGQELEVCNAAHTAEHASPPPPMTD